VAAALANPARECLRLVGTEAGLAAIAEALADAVGAGVTCPQPETLDKVDLEALLPAGAVHQGVALAVESLPEPALEDLLAGFTGGQGVGGQGVEEDHTGEEGAGDAVAGEEGAGDAVAGEEGAGDAVAGEEGAGDAVAGRESAGERSTGDDGAPAVIVMLDQVTDPHNVGAVLRSAAAFGALAVVVTERHAPEVTGALAKSASGALELVPLVRVVNLARALEQAKAAGFWCVGFDEHAADALGWTGSTALPARVVLVLGAEGHGLRRLTGERCDLRLRLPTAGPIASLNVSAAAAIALYDWRRQFPVVQGA